jgi:serine/threonine-protein kinase
MIGKEIGIYRITGKLGQGGMGTVFKAVDMNLDRVVALKVLNSEVADSPELVERFRSEARVQAGLGHPNVATLYAFLVWEGLPVMVMEFIEGETFQQMIARRGPIPAQISLPLFRQALMGIGAAHRRGIIHRDIKPANIMLNENGVVKVMDFGIAKVLGSSLATSTNLRMGTSCYMSPEQITGAVVDARSDIYSLGVTLYELLAGMLPFEGDSDFAIQTAHLEQAPAPPTVYYPHIPPHVVAAVMQALEKKPENRFASVEAFAAALEGGAAMPPQAAQTMVLHETRFAPPPPPPASPVLAPPPVAPPPPVQPFVTPPVPVGPKWGLIGGGVAAAALLAGGLFYVNSVNQQREVDRQRMVLQRQDAEKKRQAAIQAEREQEAKAEEERNAQELTERVKREQEEYQQEQEQERAKAAAAQRVARQRPVSNTQQAPAAVPTPTPSAPAQPTPAQPTPAAPSYVPPPQSQPEPAQTNYFQQLSGTWRGSYLCTQGQTEAEIVISASPKGINAVIAFAVPRSKPGSFFMNGYFLPATNQLFLRFVRWGNHPKNYVPANISGTVDLRQGAISGTVIAPGCSTIQLRRQ